MSYHPSRRWSVPKPPRSHTEMNASKFSMDGAIAWRYDFRLMSLPMLHAPPPGLCGAPDSSVIARIMPGKSARGPAARPTVAPGRSVADTNEPVTRISLFRS